MIYYLNMGFILEQALVDIVKKYIDRQFFDKLYSNFHISVVNQHPFAHLLIEDGENAADSFPAIVINSQTDSKPGDLVNMPPQFYKVGYTSSELEEIVTQTKRKKTKMNDDGEFVPVTKQGEFVYEKIPGFVLEIDDETLTKLKNAADSKTDKMIYGIKVDTIRRDRVSIEIWAENEQLKNELYEHIRLLAVSSLNEALAEQYSIFNPSISDASVSGERSSNYNVDFDVVLTGSHITFECDYGVSQIILDTELDDINGEVIPEVMNHVKN